MREKLATAIELFQVFLMFDITTAPNLVILQLRGHAAVDRGVEEIKRLLKEAGASSTCARGAAACLVRTEGDPRR